MEDAKRRELVFTLYYNYNVERLFYQFNNRLNNLFMVIQLLLSSAIIGDLSRYTSNFNLNIAIGFILAVLSALSFVYCFGEKAVSAQLATDRYLVLIHRYEKMSNDEISEALIGVNSIDSQITGAIVDIAFKRSSIQLELEDNTQLSCCQTLIAKFCGEKF